MEVITRAQAKEMGLKRYFTGKVCKNGHISERYTRQGHCIACEYSPKRKAQANARYQINKEKVTARIREDRKIRLNEYLWREIRRRAKLTNIEFSLEKSDIVVPDYCPVFGIKLEVGADNHWNSPSVDRVDNVKGYLPNNISVISYRANSIKQDATLDELKAIIAYIETHQQRNLHLDHTHPFISQGIHAW